MVERSKGDFWSRPDLVVSADGLEWSADGSSLAVRIHNLGNATAREVVVRLTDRTGAEIARQTIGEIGAPVELILRRMAVTFADLAAAAGPITVHLDPGGRVAELHGDSNTASPQRRDKTAKP